MDIIEFGIYIKSLRKEGRMTLSKLSSLSGVSHPYLSQIENGKLKGIPSPDILKKLAEPLGVSYKELMIKAGYWKEEYSDDDNKRLEDIHKGTWNLNEKIFDLLKQIVDDDGFFPEYLHGDIFEIFGGWLVLSEGKDSSFRFDEWYQNEFLNKTQEYYQENFSGDDLKEISIRFNRIYNYTSVKNGIINYSGFRKDREDFLSELVALMDRHNLTITVDEQEKLISHPLRLDLSDILETASLTSIHYKGRMLTTTERYQILGMLEVLFPDCKEQFYEKK